MRSYDHHYIDGRWTPSDCSERIEVRNPFTEQVIATVPAGTVTDAEAAVLAARAAFDGWSARSVADRAQVLRDVARGMRKRRDELVEVMIDELGAPRSAAQTVQVDVPIDVLDMICDRAELGEVEGPWSHPSGDCPNSDADCQPRAVARTSRDGHRFLTSPRGVSAGNQS